MKKININELIWFLILASFSLFIHYLFKSNKITIYMHPKMFKFVIFSFIIFTILAVLQFNKIFTDHKTPVNIGYIIFIIPLLLGFVVNPDSLNSQIAAKKGVNLTSNININSAKTISLEDEDSYQDNFDDNYDLDTTNIPLDVEDDNTIVKATPEPTPDDSTDTTIQQAGFLSTVTKIYDNLDNMLGSDVELTGFVYRDESFDKDSFVLSRLLMVCCAADVQVVGIMCKLDDNSIEDNQWIKIKGSIESTSQYNAYTEKEETIPMINISDFELIDEPLEQYIYR
jgi:putative membrane protein